MAERATACLMVKAPRPGRVKTRLAREIGEMAAVRFHRHNTATIIRRLRDDARWRLVLAVTPDSARWARWWPGDLPRIGQGGGDLGARMAHVFAQAGPGPALIVGSDIPGVTAARTGAALKALRGHDAVIGPAPDGGYWLIGLRQGVMPCGLFDSVRWSGKHARADTLANLAARGLSVAFAGELSDVDDAAGYRATGAANTRVVPPVTGAR
ncbi:MAG: TIGR04282 family arsenosugar biosynthesis glycosyltransferase [Dichotomicrobium sp.]